MMDAIGVEDAVIVSEERKEHPNFIESNTSGITLEELERNCIVPSFGDNQLTIRQPPKFTGGLTIYYSFEVSSKSSSSESSSLAPLSFIPAVTSLISLVILTPYSID